MQRKGPAAVSGAKASMPTGANAIPIWKEEFATLSRDKWLRSGEQISPGWTINLDEAGVWFLFEGREGKFWTRNPDVEPIPHEESKRQPSPALQKLRKPTRRKKSKRQPPPALQRLRKPPRALQKMSL